LVARGGLCAPAGGPTMTGEARAPQSLEARLAPPRVTIRPARCAFRYVDSSLSSYTADSADARSRTVSSAAYEKPLRVPDWRRPVPCVGPSRPMRGFPFSTDRPSRRRGRRGLPVVSMNAPNGHPISASRRNRRARCSRHLPRLKPRRQPAAAEKMWLTTSAGMKSDRAEDAGGRRNVTTFAARRAE